MPQVCIRSIVMVQGISKGFRDSTFIIDLEHLPYTATTIVVSLLQSLRGIHLKSTRLLNCRDSMIKHHPSSFVVVIIVFDPVQ